MEEDIQNYSITLMVRGVHFNFVGHPLHFNYCQQKQYFNTNTCYFCKKKSKKAKTILEIKTEKIKKSKRYNQT